MASTRNHYENLLSLFDRLCKIQNRDTAELDTLKQLLQDEVEKIKVYHLFNLNFSDSFFEQLKSLSSDFESTQNSIAKALYLCLGELLFTFETVNPRVDYSKALELSRTELPYEVVSSWNITSGLSESFSMESFFFQLNRKWLDITTPEEYQNYRESLRKENTILYKVERDTPIPKPKYEKIKQFYEHQILEYREFINSNFPEVSHEFTAFNSQVCVYIIPQDKNDNDIIAHVNIYQNYKDTSVRLYPDYIDFAFRFANLEEIERAPTTSYMGLFNEADMEKYGKYFSVKNIYHELHQIYISNAAINDLADYLLYFLKGMCFYITHSNKDDVFILKDRNKSNKCKFLLSETPSIEALKIIVFPDGKREFDSVAFKSYPDRETIKWLTNLGIEYFILEQLGRDQVNNNNGEMIHWFIRTRLKKLSVIKNPVHANGNSLLNRLERCPSGSEGWVEYENICIDAFSFLFKDDFRNYVSRHQSYTHDQIFRRDLLVNNNFTDPTSFWAQVKSEFNSNVIIIDFKNYGDTLEQNEFYLPSKYLNLIIGKFGIIFCRKGLGNSSKILQRRMFQRDKELLLCFDDDDLKGMIKEKMLGQDPTYRFENQKFSLYELD